MRQYRLPLVPGPVRVPAEVLAAREHDFPSPDMEPEFFEQYTRVERQLQTIMGTSNTVAIALGEAMVVLWGAMKSCIAPGDRVLAVSTGLFGAGFADMARGLGAEVELLEFGDNEAADPNIVEERVRAFKPRMVTAVHCETPSGILNPIEEIGSVLDQHSVELFLVDAVASIAGAPLNTDAARIDLCLLGTQKALSAPPDLGIVSISPRAWEAVKRVGYEGYSALAPFKTAVEKQSMPYTHSWQAIAGLDKACQLILAEGLESVYARHEQAAARCRERGKALGLELFPVRENISAQTVTAFQVPEGADWPTLDRRFRERGLLVGGNWAHLANKVFRLGHMGTQADVQLIDDAMDVIGESLKG